MSFDISMHRQAKKIEINKYWGSGLKKILLKTTASPPPRPHTHRETGICVYLRYHIWGNFFYKGKNFKRGNKIGNRFEKYRKSGGNIRQGRIHIPYCSGKSEQTKRIQMSFTVSSDITLVLRSLLPWLGFFWLALRWACTLIDRVQLLTTI